MPVSEEPVRKKGRLSLEGGLAVALLVSNFILPAILYLLIRDMVLALPLACLAELIVILIFVHPRPAVIRVTWGDAGAALITVILILIVEMRVSHVWESLLNRLHVKCSNVQEVSLMFAQCEKPLHFWGLILGVCVLTPIVEEVLFRKLIYNRFVRWGAVPAVLITSAIFSACHLFLYGALGLFIIGLGLQLLYLKRKNLAASMIAHALINYIAVAAGALS